jgi:plastocyanin
MNSRVTTILAGALGIMITAWACGGSDKSPTSPTPTPTPTPPAGAANVIVTITANGVTPTSFDLAVGGTVTFMNNDTSTHTPSSNPHPAHTDCPAFASVGTLQPGQSRATGALTAARACGFHDHERPSVTSLQGTVTIR